MLNRGKRQQAWKKMVFLQLHTTKASCGHVNMSGDAVMHVDQWMEPKDRALEATQLVTWRDSVWEVHAWRLNKTWRFFFCLQRYNNIQTSFHCCLADAESFFLFFPLGFKVYQELKTLITQITISGAIVVIVSPKAVSIDMLISITGKKR